jgi:hypothetical protein
MVKKRNGSKFGKEISRKRFYRILLPFISKGKRIWGVIVKEIPTNIVGTGGTK